MEPITEEQVKEESIPFGYGEWLHYNQYRRCGVLKKQGDVYMMMKDMPPMNNAQWQTVFDALEKMKHKTREQADYSARREIRDALGIETD
jgi:hypothetical protein